MSLATLRPSKNLLPGLGGKSGTITTLNNSGGGGGYGTNYTVLNSYSIMAQMGALWNSGIYTSPIHLTAGNVYTLSAVIVGAVAIDIWNPDSTLLVTNHSMTTPYTFTASQTGNYAIRFKNGAQNETFWLSNWQLEPGTVATSFTPYGVTNAPLRTPQAASTGLSFNQGNRTTDYITAPFQPYVSINGNFRIDGSFMIPYIPPGANAYCIMQNSNSASDRVALGVNTSGQLCLSYYDGTSWHGVSTPGAVPVGSQINFTAIYDGGVLALYVNGAKQSGNGSTYAGTVNDYCHIGQPTSNQAPNSFVGVLSKLKITNLDTGIVGLNLDFTNPLKVVGNTVFQTTPVNLIPSFKDSRWSINPNAVKMGDASLHLNGTAGNQTTTINIPVSLDMNYLLLGNLGPSNNANTRVKINKTDGTNLAGIDPISTKQMTWNSGLYTMIQISCFGTTSGQFDFSNIQFFLLTGQEATINGSPTLLQGQAKRTLYSLR